MAAGPCTNLCESECVQVSCFLGNTQISHPSKTDPTHLLYSSADGWQTFSLLIICLPVCRQIVLQIVLLGGVSNSGNAAFVRVFSVVFCLKASLSCSFFSGLQLIISWVRRWYVEWRGAVQGRWWGKQGFSFPGCCSWSSGAAGTGVAEHKPLCSGVPVSENQLLSFRSSWALKLGRGKLLELSGCC